MSKGSILIVDDDAGIRSYLSAYLAGSGYEVESLESGTQAVARLERRRGPDVVLLDVMMPGMSGLELLECAKRIDPGIGVVMLSAVGQTKIVVEAMRLGAADYLTKPFEEEDLELAIHGLLQHRAPTDEAGGSASFEAYADYGDILSASKEILHVKDIARRVADADVPVLILGESGVGKEVVARYIHRKSKRSHKPLVKVNCAALPHDLLESELFGYERGAFTGALTDKPGKFELAHGGTILLDEIGEMSPGLQAKLLHVLQDGEYSRLGGRRPIEVDVRVLASTNKRLGEAVAKGEFREDLYYRLDVIRLEIPALRKRPEDIPLLADYFIQRYRERYRSPFRQLPPELAECFVHHDWPGNVRQLENVVKRLLILTDVSAVLSELRGAGPAPAPVPIASVKDSSVVPVNLKQVGALAAEKAERDAVLRVLEATGWNRKLAARELGVCYKALLNKLKKWNLDNRTQSVPPEISFPEARA
jgi:DNA-binding NtrC family response regulator